MRTEESESESNSIDIIKFPRTHHLFDTGGVGRDDLVMNEKETLFWFRTNISLEEKVDGSNLGISVGEDGRLLFQNRSHFVTVATQQQWRQLDAWSTTHSAALWELLGSRQFVLYGEWCYAKHSIHYTNIPDLFLVFDLYDKKTEKFLSRKARDKKLEGSGLFCVPLVREGVFSRDELRKLLDSTKSKFYDGPVEGMYLRYDDEEFLRERAKLVRKEFLQSDEFNTHYLKKALVKNIVTFGVN